MFDLIFFRDKDGNSDVLDYLCELRDESFRNKDCRVNLNKITAYMDMLQEYGTFIGTPFVKYIEDDIWELSPLSNRIFFAFINNATYIVLSCYIKKSKKTPKREIKKARDRLEEYRRRNV